MPGGLGLNSSNSWAPLSFHPAFPLTSNQNSVVQYLGVLKVNLWEYKGNILTQKG